MQPLTSLGLALLSCILFFAPYAHGTWRTVSQHAAFCVETYDEVAETVYRTRARLCRV